MRHKWLLLMCVGVILVQATLANAEDGSNSQNESEEGANQAEVSDQQSTQSPSVDEQNADKDFENDSMNPENNSTDTDTATAKPQKETAYDEHVHSNRESKAVIPAVGRTTTKKPSYICTKSNLNYDCILQNVQLNHNEPNIFGLDWKNNLQKKVTFTNSRLQFLPKRLFEAFPEMELLNAEDLQIEEIEYQAFKHAKKLKTLYLKRNLISNIETFKGVPLLVHLDLSHNRITHFNKDAFAKNRELERLLMNHNHISELPGFQNIDNLEELNLSNNDLQEISDNQFRGNPKLNSLDASFNLLRHFNLNQLNDKPNLSFISVSFNNLESLYIPGQVQKLDARNNSISNINANICSLQNLYLSNNQITDISALRNCRSMKILNLSHNKLQSIDLIESMPELSNLNVAHNQLFEINFPAKVAHPLQILDLSYNQLSFGPTNKFDQMKTLKLNNNNFIEFKFGEMMKSLNYVQLSNNEWSCEKITQIMQEKREIIFDKNEICVNSQARSQNGICCKDYKRAFNDRLKEMIQEIYVHENVNKKDQEKCKPTKPKIGVNKPNVQTMHNKIAELDSSTREILNELEGVKSQITHIEQEIISNTTRQHKLQTANQNIKQLVEKYSGNYGIPKEGLISPSKTLEKVVKYTQDRKSNSENLLARRTKEVEATNARMESKNSEKFTSQSENEGLEAVLKNIKADESKLKKEKQLLEKTLNRNSPSVHG
ncbi:probable serine/threonine-protein kinase DDB_G0278509 isoform X1 [Culex pipiens pallens]|uniref:probable serine/threonine-protein kinase DDB_G0278509 isoform X1 n=1 Tax=Culex pipiens pallens TaxID=42434 RepID=UPI0019539031|nr:probable serine/threonine-protein kinase DDB_G0278509 isoform X1 [Culex pipiens pallens]